MFLILFTGPLYARGMAVNQGFLTFRKLIQTYYFFPSISRFIIGYFTYDETCALKFMHFRPLVFIKLQIASINI